jgi:hypothetical protein
MSVHTNPHRANADIFWGEIAPTDHVLQVYDNDDIFLDALAGFIGGGINSGDCVVLIATSRHLGSIQQRLIDYGISVQTLIEDDRFIPLDAETTLSKFMRDGWPDEQLFNETVTQLFEKAECKGRHIRAFGEMVAILWEKGYHGATVQLEHLWNNFREKNNFTLFCAYPKAGFTGNIHESIKTICNCHTKMIDGTERQLTEVLYSEALSTAV